MTNEYYVGSNLTGSSGATSRVLTLSNTRITSATNFSVYLDGSNLSSSQFTASHQTNGTTVTFDVNVWDSQNIIVSYQTTTSSTTDGYCSVDDVRDITGLTTSDISDDDLEALIAKATLEVNRKLNVRVIRERISYIDGTRENDIDGSNTTFYVRNWKGKYLADDDNNGTVTTSDVLVYAVDNDDTETEATVSSITHDECKFVLGTAYDSTYDLYVTYSYSHYDESTPGPLVNLATCFLAAAYSKLKSDSGCQNVRFGNVSISKDISQSFGSYYNRFEQIINDLRAYSNLKENYGESNVKI